MVCYDKVTIESMMILLLLYHHFRELVPALVSDRQCSHKFSEVIAVVYYDKVTLEVLLKTCACAKSGGPSGLYGGAPTCKIASCVPLSKDLQFGSWSHTSSRLVKLPS